MTHRPIARAASAQPAASTAIELTELARLARRLSPDCRDPERFHIERDELAKRLAQLARRAEGAR
jgi:hypothetical protein